jgi:hypothetical protein
VSDTPRTDAKAQFFGFNPDEGEEFVQADFVRELERENAALRADSERLDWLTDALDWVELGDCVPTEHDAEGRSRLDAWRLAIDAARKEQP